MRGSSPPDFVTAVLNASCASAFFFCPSRAEPRLSQTAAKPSPPPPIALRARFSARSKRFVSAAIAA